MEAPKNLLTKHNLLNVNEDVQETKDTRCFIGDCIFNDQDDCDEVSYKVAMFYPQQIHWNVPVDKVQDVIDYLHINNINVKV